jgi:hypothetical protein
LLTTKPAGSALSGVLRDEGSPSTSSTAVRPASIAHYGRRTTSSARYLAAWHYGLATLARLRERRVDTARSYLRAETSRSCRPGERSIERSASSEKPLSLEKANYRCPGNAVRRRQLEAENRARAHVDKRLMMSELRGGALFRAGSDGGATSGRVLIFSETVRAGARCSQQHVEPSAPVPLSGNPGIPERS